MITEESCTIIVNANQFYPTLLTKTWLVENNIIPENDIENYLNGNGISQIKCANFFLTMLPNQVSFSIINDLDKKDIHLLLNCINALERVQFLTAGINFAYSSPLSNDVTKNLSREKYFFTNSKVHSLFDNEDAKFGVYLSKNFHGTRLKLEILPSLVQSLKNPLPREVLSFTYNYHKILDPNNNKQDLLEFIDDAQSFQDNSREIMNSII